MSEAQTDPMASFKNELRKLTEVAAYSVDECTVATLIACMDERVQERLEDRLSQPSIYQAVGIQCLGHDERGNEKILFRFVCRTGVICLVDPSFLVLVNIADRQIVSILDPYIPHARPQKCCCSGAAPAPGNGRSRVGDAVDDLADIISGILNQGILCSVLLGSNECRRTGRCNEGVRHLRQFNDNPNGVNAQDLADWINASSMNENCMKAIVKYKDTVDYAVFIAAVAAAAAA